MPRIILFLFSCLLFSFFANAQSKTSSDHSFSHFYFVLDSVAYNTLKTNSFCKDSLFLAYESASHSDQGNWSGNYLLGNYDYLEVMKPDKVNAISAGSIGVGQMINRPGDLAFLQKEWQALTKDKIEQLAFTENKGKDSFIVELMNYRDSMMSGGMACFFVLYYHPALLIKSGFSETAVLDSGISQEAIQRKWYGKALENKLYRKVEKITLRLTPHEFERHKIALKAWGYKQTGNYCFKKEIEIVVQVEKNPSHRLKEILFSLNHNVAQKNIELSPNASILLNRKEGRLIILPGGLAK